MGLTETGGRQFLTSFWTVCNELALNSPNVLRTLANDWRYEMPTT